MRKQNQIIQGDCLEKLKELEDNSVDSIVTDPPYHLVSIVKRFGKEGSAPAKEGTDGSFKRLSAGFMGKEWDGVDENGMGIAMNVEMWKECLRVLKPGGHLLAFSGTRTYHRMAVAIEDAGFEVRDMIEWVYSTGFPKSLNIAKYLDKQEGVEHPKNTPISDNGSMSGANYTRNKMDVQSELAKQWEGWGTALKPAHEPICMARKPLAEKTVAENCLKYGTGGINIDESRVEIPDGDNSGWSGSETWNEDSTFTEKGKCTSRTKPLGRFPANLIHDGSEEVRECFPETKGAKETTTRVMENPPESWKQSSNVRNINSFGDSGNASRFFKSILYYPKASKSERNNGCEELETKDAGASMNSRCATCGKQKLDHETSRCKCEVHIPAEMKSREGVKNNHPTVKPIALMEYLIKMVTPKGGVVLDPFAGSGSTLVSAKQNGYQYIGIEMEKDYIPIIEARLNGEKSPSMKIYKFNKKYL